MRTPFHSTVNLRRTLRGAVLGCMILFLACGEDGDHYAPLGNDETPRATVVAGTVRDASRAAVTDAVIVMEPAADGIPASVEWLSKSPDAAKSATMPGRRVTTTNDRGRFSFTDVETGEYFLQVIADDHLGAMHSIRVPDRTAFVDTVYVDVNLTPTGTFSGVATLENAASHQGTVVYVQGTSYVAVTDPTGAYAITNVPVGGYTIRAEHAHYLEDTENGTITMAGENVGLAAMLLKIDSNIPPVATIASATPLFDSLPVNFVASGSDADGTIVLYEWDWEDDGTFDYSNNATANVAHGYSAGSYRAKLRVTDDDGAIGLAVIEFTVVVTASTRVYMSTSGSDANDGSIGSPVATLAKAYQIAQAEAKDEILIAQGVYGGAPAFLADIDVLGGRSLPTWEESVSGYSTFNFAASRATANNITTLTTIRRVALNMTLPAGGTNSIALYSLGSNGNLHLEQCQFTAANGLGGSDGTNGSGGASASAGANGANGSCDGARGLGGSGGSSPAGCTGGAGGAGGSEGDNAGDIGSPGLCAGSGGTGGLGGAGYNGGAFNCSGAGGTGTNGINGGTGIAGSNGAAASGTGSIVANDWVPNTSGSGSNGSPGRGGGGGGGGGGQGGTACNDGGGNGGGGGGGGGSGGTLGTGGVGGRASFAVMLVNSSPLFDTCTFTRGIGGTGGNGGTGGIGGIGGAGGIGASLCTAEVGRGGNGGAGGNGGFAGGGGGGPGGPSYGIYRAVGSAPTIISPTYIGGFSGGAGGNGGGGAPDGPAGPSGDVN